MTSSEAVYLPVNLLVADLVTCWSRTPCSHLSRASPRPQQKVLAVEFSEQPRLPGRALDHRRGGAPVTE